VDFQVAPARIYEALLDAKQSSAFTGQGARSLIAQDARVK
jgi:hypothetical protein